MKLEEIKQFTRIEYIDKNTKSNHNRTGIYRILDTIKVKNPITKKWFLAILYTNELDNKSYAKCIKDILKEFKVYKE